RRHRADGRSAPIPQSSPRIPDGGATSSPAARARRRLTALLQLPDNPPAAEGLCGGGGRCEAFLGPGGVAGSRLSCARALTRQIFAPILIGLELTLISLISIRSTNTHESRAQPGVVGCVGGRPVEQLWLFWIALVGGVIGAAAYPFIGVT